MERSVTESPRQEESRKEESSKDMAMPLDVVRRLAINDSGFVFDPVSGRSFSTNETGREILRLACTEREPRRIAERLMERFEVDLITCEREILEFVTALRRIGG